MVQSPRIPQVSILVPVYNAESYLEQCLNSLTGQTLRDIEIVVVDDGSTDGSSDIIDDCARGDERVHAIHKANSGYGDSMNAGLELASAPWIAICEPDDYAEPTMCEHLLSAAERFSAAGTSVDIVKGSYMRVVNKGSGQPEHIPSWTFHAPQLPRRPFSIDECPDFLTGHPSIWTALYRRRLIDELGIRFLPIPGSGWADNPFFIETMVAARSIAYVDEIVYNYREFEDGTVSHLSDWRIITDRWKEMGEVLDRYDVESPAIITAHCHRGCAYLQMLHDDFEQDDELVAAAREMASTLDFDLVRHSTLTPLKLKLAYARYLSPAKRAILFAGWLGLKARELTVRTRPMRAAARLLQ